MGIIRAMLLNNIKRNYFSITFSFLCGLMLCVLFVALGNVAEKDVEDDIYVGLIDHDQSVLSEDFGRYLKEDMSYLIETGTYEHLSSQLIEKKISVIIEIPEGFYQNYQKGNIEALILTSLDDYENVAFIQLYLNNYMSSIDLLSQVTSEEKGNFSEHMTARANQHGIKEVKGIEKEEGETSGRLSFINSIGFYLNFVFINCIFIIFFIFDDRVSKVFHRIQVAPIAPVKYLIGNGLFGFLVCLIEILIFCGYLYITKSPIGVPLGIVILVMSLLSVFSVCFSLAVALLVKSKNSIISIIITYSTIGSILGGAYFQIETAPKQLQVMARIFPQFWFMDTFRKLQSNFEGAIYLNIVVLSLFAILSLLLGAVIFQQNYKNS